ncbi:MAG: hypothetical protein R3A11_08165 [Bdellovibrionota bacterium]
MWCKPITTKVLWIAAFFLILSGCNKKPSSTPQPIKPKATTLDIGWLTEIDQDPWLQDLSKCFVSISNLQIIRLKSSTKFLQDFETLHEALGFDTLIESFPAENKLIVKNSLYPEGRILRLEKNPTCKEWQYMLSFVLIYSSPQGALVKVDQVDQGHSPTWAFVDTGSHRLECYSENQVYRAEEFSFPKDLSILCKRENIHSPTQEVMDFGSEQQERKTAWFLYVLLGLGAIASGIIPFFIF